MNEKSTITFMLALLMCAGAAASDWPHYGGGLDGARFSPGTALTPSNADELTQAWVYRTGDIADGDKTFGKMSSFKATPILLDDQLIFSTGFNRVIAVDARTGALRWQFDPALDLGISYAEMFTSRGVAGWRDPRATDGQPCRTRIFAGTLDARLIAIDAANGKPCRDFGTKGEVDLSAGIKNFRRGEYAMTSPPTVVNGVIIAGSSIGDNGGVRLDSGVVRGFDARTGELKWSYDPIPRHKGAPGWDTWTKQAARHTGAANVWSAISADPERDLVFLPSTSPSPDFYGGERLGDNAFANSVVALRASTGEFVWAYQLVHHDLWDYDNAAQPLLIDIPVGDNKLPALVQASKTGFVFVLNRETGEPLHAVNERVVPASDVHGEIAAGSQPFPRLQLHATSAPMPPVWAHSDDHVAACRQMLAGVRYEGIFTPPSLEGTLVYPGNPGGVNWGSMAAHKERAVAFALVNRLPTVVRLIPRKRFRRAAKDGTVNGVKAQFTEQNGTPYGMARYELYNRDNILPCLEGPWGTLVAMDVAAARVLWEVPFGYFPGTENDPQASRWGGFGYGGPLVTAAGVVIAASRLDAHLRAFDARDGTALWSAALPAQPEATPMSYQLDATQYVVIAAGGALADGDGRGDYLIAFSVAAAPD